MNDYIVSARKYRPMTFSSVVGQKALTTTLKNAVKSGKLAHAYLFCGPRGVGKTTCARIFAKTINCYHPTPEGEACNECESCKAFNEGRSLNIFELDAASNNGVDKIKDLMEQTRIPPQLGRYKVFIIDEVHMLSPAAFNAFLKTLEEPPAHVIFILATTEKHKILPTILSRCQIYDFERMTIPEIIGHLKNVAQKEHILYEDEALNLIAEKADGGMRDALSIFDQAASYSQGNITYKMVLEDLNVLDADNYFSMTDMALQNKVADIMVLLNNIISKGFDGMQLISGLALHMRNLLMAQSPQTLPLMEVSQQQREKYAGQAKKCPPKFLYQALQILNRCDVQYRQSSNKRLLIELTLIEVAQITQGDDTQPAAGRSPERLKSLFTKSTPHAQPKPEAQVSGADNHVGSAAQSGQSKDQDTHTQAHTPQSDPQSTAQPAAQPKLKLGQLGMSFSSLLKEYKQEKDDSEPTSTDIPDEQPSQGQTGDKQNAFTQEQVQKQWRAMCVRMPENLQAMAQRMKLLTPTITNFPNIEVPVMNTILLNDMTRIKNRIRATLQSYLGNNRIEITFRLAEGKELKPILTKPQLFNKLKNENPAFAKLADRLSLTVE